MVCTIEKRVSDALPFQFDFQRNAAIILALQNIKELRSLRLDWNCEDIDLTLENGKKILVKAIAIEKPWQDMSYVRDNMIDALASLSERAQGADVQELILITNDPKPFNDGDPKSLVPGARCIDATQSYWHLNRESCTAT